MSSANIDLIRAHVEKNKDKDRATFSIAGIKELLAAMPAGDASPIRSARSREGDGGMMKLIERLRAEVEEQRKMGEPIDAAVIDEAADTITRFKAESAELRFANATLASAAKIVAERAETAEARAEDLSRQLAERDEELARTFDPDRLASIVANIRQGESETPRCESPGEADIAIARSWVVRVLKALATEREG